MHRRLDFEARLFPGKALLKYFWPGHTMLIESIVTQQ